MTREEIIEQVNGLLSEEFEVEQNEFTPDANLKDTLQLDSINLVDLIALVQVTYKITIPVNELHQIQTFKNLSTRGVWNPFSFVNGVISDDPANPAIVDATSENARFIINGLVYDILLIDDPMGMHEHLEIYLRFVGG